MMHVSKISFVSRNINIAILEKRGINFETSDTNRNVLQMYLKWSFPVFVDLLQKIQMIFTRFKLPRACSIFCEVK